MAARTPKPIPKRRTGRKNNAINTHRGIRTMTTKARLISKILRKIDNLEQSLGEEAARNINELIVARIDFALLEAKVKS